ncbi:hypothetical protein AGMMS50276_31950 [Synergistales bacterium]|nr:hypothetical protein AGMMS50276_31950 [Synergistales bacterium]
MSISSGLLKIAIIALSRELPKVYREGIEKAGAKEIEEIINVHAVGAAAVGLASGWIPAAGGMAGMMASTGFVWSMYYRINKKIGIPISKTAAKSLGSAVLSNLAGSCMAIVGGTILATLLSFTGIGNFFSSLIMASMDYAVVLVAGIIYLKLLTGLFKAGKDPANMSGDDLKSHADDVIRQENTKQLLKDAVREYKKKRKDGEVSGKESVTLEEDEKE